MAHSHHTQDSGSDQGVLYGAAVFSLCIAAGLLYAFISSAPEVTPVDDASFEPPTLQIDEGRLDAERERQFPKMDLKAPKVVEFQNAVRQANLLQFGSPNSTLTRDAEIAVEYAANDAASEAGGYGGFVEFANPLYHACQTELARALDSISRGDVTFEVMTNEPPADFDVYRETCGNVLPILVNTGLVTGEGAWRDPKSGPIVFEILSRLRIAFIIHLRTPAMSQLTPYEREILWRWRIEDPHAYPSKERLTYLNTAFGSTDEDVYPTPLDAARVYFREGRKGAALKVVEPWCKKKKNDAQLQNYCTFLRANVGADEEK